MEVWFSSLPGVIKVAAFVILIICCFLFGGNDKPPEINAAPEQTLLLTGLFLAFIRSLQLILGTMMAGPHPFFLQKKTSIPEKVFHDPFLVEH